MEDSYKKVQRILFIILLANVLVAVLKIFIGSLIKSTSMTADGFHSLSDGSSNIVGLIGIHFASKPEDDSHPYGHNKFETLAGLFISFMLFVLSGRIFLSAIERFKEPIIPEISLESILVLIFTLITNIFVSIIEHKKGEELNSQILISDAAHTKSDIYISIGVLATLIGIKLGLPPVIDSIVSIIVACFIIHAGYEIFRENGDILVDSVAVDSNVIKDIVTSFEEVKDVHKIRSRGSKNNLFIDLHIEVDPKLDVEKSHQLVHNIEYAIRKNFNKNSNVIVHVEPYDEKR
ncbi:MAG TPA: cation diffusion facilitator family transporter [Tissierellaceae bacterium]